jgi:ribose 5-phosphate isomerase A
MHLTRRKASAGLLVPQENPPATLCDMSDPSAAKKAAANAAADLVKTGMSLGLGSGSTFLFVLDRLAERIQQEGLEVRGTPTSLQTAQEAERRGIPLVDLNDVERLDLAIDGADEIDPQKRMIKGGGAALMREKLVAAAAREMVVIVDESKLVPVLGSGFALPVEVLPFGWRHTERHIASTGCSTELRMRDNEPLKTDNGNYIIDCKYEAIDDPEWLHEHLNAMPGVLENGLFIGLAGRVLVGDSNGKTRLIP